MKFRLKLLKTKKYSNTKYKKLLKKLKSGLKFKTHKKVNKYQNQKDRESFT